MSLVLRSGGQFDFASLRSAVTSFWDGRLCGPLARGRAPSWLPLASAPLAHFDDILGTAEGRKLSLELEMCLYHLRRLRDFLAAFNRKHYESSSLTGGPRYALRFGLHCARAVEAMTGSGPRLEEGTSPVESYVRLARGDDDPGVPALAEMPGARPGGRLKVLVVQDEPDILALCQFALDKAGFRVLGAPDGVEGVSVACGWRPDLILLNYLMPRMDGLTACGKLRDNPRTWNIPILMQSGLDRADLAHEAIRLGAAGWLYSLFDMGNLPRVVLQTLACEEA